MAEIWAKTVESEQNLAQKMQKGSQIVEWIGISGESYGEAQYLRCSVSTPYTA